MPILTAHPTIDPTIAAAPAATCRHRGFPMTCAAVAIAQVEYDPSRYASANLPKTKTPLRERGPLAHFGATTI